MFFSRRIGISEDDGEIPVLGGVRLTGRTGKQTLGLLSVLTDDAFDEPRTAFSNLRLKRDVGTSGYVGAMLTDRRDQQDAETDAGVGFSLWPTRRLNVTGFAAVTSAYRDREADKAYRLRAKYQDDRVFAQAQHLLVGPDAETGMGFVTRTDIRGRTASGSTRSGPGRSASARSMSSAGAPGSPASPAKSRTARASEGCRSSGTAGKG